MGKDIGLFFRKKAIFEGYFRVLVFVTLIFFIRATSFGITQAGEYHTNHETVIIGGITFTGNKTTKDHIICRELLFKSGDTLQTEKIDDLLAQSRLNLLNTSLFNFVEVETWATHETPPVLNIAFHFTERWYIWPVPVAEFGDRNFNEWWETKDFSRLNVGFFLNHTNFRGRKELLQAAFLTGYSQALGLAYMKPNINEAQTFGLGFTAIYNRKRELAYATQNDKPAFYDKPGEYSVQSLITNVLFYYRPHIYQSHSLWLQYNQYRFGDMVYSLNPDFFINSETSPYFLSLIYEYRSDHRNLKYYPTSGSYFDVLLSKHGLGILQNNGLNVLNISTSYKRYLELSPHWFLFAGATAKISSGRQPYFMKPSLGYMYDFVRGYEYYVVDGRHTALLKANLKYRILAPRVINLPFLGTDRFSKLHLSLYLGFHSDLGYVYEPHNPIEWDNRLPNKMLWGNGIGFDIVTYYDKVMRMEYSLNHWGEHGFFLHFLAPI
jgi:hypothetical protein